MDANSCQYREEHILTDMSAKLAKQTGAKQGSVSMSGFSLMNTCA
jgi:hypothetical protein